MLQPVVQHELFQGTTCARCGEWLAEWSPDTGVNEHCDPRPGRLPPESVARMNKAHAADLLEINSERVARGFGVLEPW